MSRRQHPDENDVSRARDGDHTLLRTLQIKEAEWTQEELQDCVRLIQRYRATYLAAIFATIGWLLAQVLEASGDPEAISPTLAVLRSRADIATVLCIVPLLNSLFVVLVFETEFRMESLARYKFMLGHELNQGEPAWRWEIWKETPEGSYRAWTNPSNVIFGLVALTLPSAALWFGFPAVRNSNELLLWSFWFFSLTVFVSLIILAIYLAVKNVSKNQVARPLETGWQDLKTQPRKKGRWRSPRIGR